MECVRAKELLSEYVDGILDETTKERLGVHLSGCKNCRHDLDALKKMMTELNRLEPVKPPLDFLDRIHERLEPSTGFFAILKKLFFPLRIKLPLELAAAAAVALIIVGVIRIQNNQTVTRQPPPISISRSVTEQKPVSKQSSRRLRKSEIQSYSDHLTPQRILIGQQPIELVLVVKSDISAPGPRQPRIQSSPSALQTGKTASVADEKNRSGSYYSQPQAESEPPAEDAVAPVAPGISAARDTRPFEAKSRSKLYQTRLRVETLVQVLAGEVLSGKEDLPAPEHETMTVNLPADRYNEFVRRLGSLAPLQSPPPSPPQGQSHLRVEIRFVSDH